MNDLETSIQVRLTALEAAIAHFVGNDINALLESAHRIEQYLLGGINSVPAPTSSIVVITSTSTS